MGEHFQLIRHIRVNHRIVGLPSVEHRLMDDHLRREIHLNDGGSAEELLRSVKRFTFCDEETERSVGIASDPEDGGVFACLGADFHGRTDMPVAVFADTGSGILSCQ